MQSIPKHTYITRLKSRVMATLKDCYNYTLRVFNSKCTKEGIKDGVMAEFRIYCCTCGELQRLGRMLLLLQRLQCYSKITVTFIKFEEKKTTCQLLFKIKNESSR